MPNAANHYATPPRDCQNVSGKTLFRTVPNQCPVVLIRSSLHFCVVYTDEVGADPDRLQSAAEAVRDDGQLASAVCHDNNNNISSLVCAGGLK